MKEPFFETSPSLPHYSLAALPARLDRYMICRSIPVDSECLTNDVYPASNSLGGPNSQGQATLGDAAPKAPL